MQRLTLIVVYLSAICAANLSIAHWGTQAAIYNGFLFIGLDFTTRDRLHSIWHQHLARNMSALILTGSVLSYLLGIWLGSTFPGGPTVGRIAFASCAAFALAATADTITYHLLRNRSWFERANQSNVVSSAVDSIAFPWIAFGAFIWPVVFGLFCAKIAGGVVWSFVLNRSSGQEWLDRNRELYGAGSRP